MSSRTLRKAAGCGDQTRVRLMLNSGANANTTDAEGNTPLVLAAQSGWQNCVRTLIQAGANVNCVVRYGQTALLKAVRNGHLACAEELINAGADVNAADQYGNTALMKALQADTNNNVSSYDLVETLLKAGADVNRANVGGDTALFIALRRGNTECAELFIEAGADVNLVKDNGNTALMAAVEGVAFQSKGKVETSGTIKCIKLLLRSGAQINKTNGNGQNALEYYVAQSESVVSDIFMLLFAAGETIGNTMIQNIIWSESENPDLPREFTEKEPSEFSLMDLSRRAIRGNLLKRNANVHLFDRMTSLKIPPILRHYLLYNVKF